MTDMVEKVAAAMWFDFVDQQGYPNGLPTWKELSRINEATQAEYRSLARAAIEAMRSADDDILACLFGEIYGTGDAEAAWNRAIDAALTTGE
jgi:hypothetical protein